VNRLFGLNKNFSTAKNSAMNQSNLDFATIGGGCFWCTEAVFQRLRSVKTVESGYAGGKIDNPTYKQICSGDTEHAEVIRVGFDPQIIKYDDILRVFFYVHDPTTLNRQGVDYGTQYRSVIFYNDDAQKSTALRVIKEIEEMGVYKDPIVTEVSPLPKFYKAEDNHQDYYNTNPSEGYCKMVVQSKVEKFLKLFKDVSQESV